MLYNTFIAMNCVGMVQESQGTIVEKIDVEHSHGILSPDDAITSLRHHWNHTDVQPSIMAQDSAVMYIYPNVCHPLYFLYTFVL